MRCPTTLPTSSSGTTASAARSTPSSTSTSWPIPRSRRSPRSCAAPTPTRASSRRNRPGCTPPPRAFVSSPRTTTTTWRGSLRCTTRSTRIAAHGCRRDEGRVTPVWLASLFLFLASAGGTDAEATEAVWRALRMPGAVVVVRHSYAPGGFDPPHSRLDDCSTQRNLDDNGRAQARRIGEAFRQRGIAVGEVLSSPRCRCLDTGRLAFGAATAWEPLQGALADTERRQRQLTEIRRRI